MLQGANCHNETWAGRTDEKVLSINNNNNNNINNKLKNNNSNNSISVPFPRGSRQHTQWPIISAEMVRAESVYSSLKCQALL